MTRPATAAEHLRAAEALLFAQPGDADRTLTPGDIKAAELHVKAARLRFEMTFGRDRVREAVTNALRAAGVVANKSTTVIADAVVETWEGMR